jgi:hypothetical protein
MAISNTSILIKRSLTTGKPASAQQGEFAYSYASNTLYIGSPAGTGVVNVGGQFYTSTLDAATSSNTASALVKRDSTGAFSGRLIGNSDSASTLASGQNFSITGDVLASAVSFNGTSAVALSAALNTINPNSGTFGSSTTIPIITVGANGRITSVTTSPVASSGGGSSFLTISDGTTTNTINIAASTFYIQGNKGVTTTVSGNTVTIGTDTTVLRSNTIGLGTQIISTDLSVVGNLTVAGAFQYTNTAVYQTVDSLIELAANNTGGDVVDIGFYGLSNTNTALTNSNYFHGLIRAGSGGGAGVAGNFYLFKNLNTNPTSNTVAYAQLTGANTGNLVANIVNSTIYNSTINSLSSALSVGNGGTGTTSLASGQVLLGGGTNAINTLANVSLSNTGTVATNSTITNLTVDAYGRVNTVTYTAISGLTVSQGGTGQSTFTNGQLIVGNGGTGPLQSLANVTPTVTGSLSATNTITSLTVDAYGRITAYTGAAIAIAASQVTSGQLAIAQGGTNSSSFTNNQLTYYNGTSIVSLANSTFSNTGSYGANTTITALQVDGFGRTNTAIYTPISGLTVGQGGTGTSTFTSSGVIYGNGTGALQVTALAGSADQTWSNQILTVTNAGVPVWSSAMDGGTF